MRSGGRPGYGPSTEGARLLEGAEVCVGAVVGAGGVVGTLVVDGSLVGVVGVVDGSLVGDGVKAGVVDDVEVVMDGVVEDEVVELVEELVVGAERRQLGHQLEGSIDRFTSNAMPLPATRR